MYVLIGAACPPRPHPRPMAPPPLISAGGACQAPAQIGQLAKLSCYQSTTCSHQVGVAETRNLIGPASAGVALPATKAALPYPIHTTSGSARCVPIQSMTETEMKTNKGAQSALKPKTDAGVQAEREALLFPEAARFKQAIRKSLASKQAQGNLGKRGGKATGRKARTFGISLLPEMREEIQARIDELKIHSGVSSFSHYFQQLVARDLAQAKAERALGIGAEGAPAAAVEDRNIGQERFNPEIESLIRDYQAANPCARQSAIEGLLTRFLLKHQPVTGQPSLSPQVSP